MSDIPTYHKGQRNFGTGYDMMARIAELEAERRDANRRAAMQGIYTDRQQCRAERAEAALDEIIMEATSRNHAIDIARRSRHGKGGE